MFNGTDPAIHYVKQQTPFEVTADGELAMGMFRSIAGTGQIKVEIDSFVGDEEGPSASASNDGVVFGDNLAGCGSPFIHAFKLSAWPSGPLLAGVEGVTNPVLIRESMISPEMPELARVARVDGQVILQAIVKRDGSIGDISVIHANRPNLGFEDAAIAAVRQWRYEPAQKDGEPVDVYFTLVIDFSLVD
jgi:TonB family protein